MSGPAGCLDSKCCNVSDGEATRLGHWQKLYKDTYKRMVELAVEQLIGNVKVFVKHCAED